MGKNGKTIIPGTRKEIKDVLIPVAILVLFSLLPGVGLITKTGMLIVGAFIALLYGWVINVDPAICIVILLFYALVQGEAFSSSIFTDMISSSNLWLVVFALWFSAALRTTGVIDYMANQLLKIKIAKKGPYCLMVVLMISTYVITGITGMTAVPIIIFFLEILQGVARQMHLKQYSLWTVCAGLGLSITAMMGSVAMPYSPMTAVIMSLLQAVGLTASVNLMKYALVNVIAAMLTVVVLTAVTKFIIRPDIDKETFHSLELGKEQVEFTEQMKWGTAALVVLVLLMALPDMLPDTWLLTYYLDIIGTTGALAIADIVLCVAPDGKGGHIFNFKETARNMTDWSQIFYLGGVFYLGGLMATDDLTGIPSFISVLCSPLNALPPLLAVVIVILLCSITTNFITNSVSALIYGAVGASVVASSPSLEPLLIIGITIVCYVACAMPSSSVNAMVLHSKRDMFQTKHLVTLGFVFSILTTLVLCGVILLLKGLFI